MPGIRRAVVAALAAISAAGCQPTIGDAPGIVGGVQPDAGPPTGGDPEPDAQPIEPEPDDGGDGPGNQPVEVILSQTENEEILDEHSVACAERDSDGVPVQNRENSFYRVFELEEEGVEGTFSVESVRFGVESATTQDGSAQPATVRLHTLAGGDFLIDNMTQIASVTVDIAPQNLTVIEVPIQVDVSAGSTLVFELFIPDSTVGRLFFIGSNDNGQTGPGFLRAPATGCDFLEPTDLVDVGDGFPNVHMVMSVSGTTVR
jgi:hypothetical protein